MSLERKRILIVHSTLHIGGAEEVTANLCNQIDKDRFDVKVCYLKEKGVVGDRIEEQGTEVIGLPKKHPEKTDYFTAFKLRAVIKKHNIQLVHSHDVHALTDCSLCKITLPGLKFIHTFHYGNYPERHQSFRRLERTFWRFPTRLVSVSNRQQQGVKQLYGIPDSRIETVWNGVDVEVDPQPFELVDRAKAEGKVIIGSINTLIEQKGMFDLLEVAQVLKSRLPGKFVFLIAGDGHLKSPLESKVKEMGLDEEVRFLGWVNKASRNFLPHIDIFFQPSLWEAMSMVLLEAMSGAKAIVATGVGETPYIIEDETQGVVTAVGDIQGMAKALENLVSSEEKRRQHGVAARERYISSFTARNMAARYEVLYQSLLK